MVKDFIDIKFSQESKNRLYALSESRQRKKGFAVGVYRNCDYQGWGHKCVRIHLQKSARHNQTYTNCRRRHFGSDSTLNGRSSMSEMRSQRSRLLPTANLLFIRLHFHCIVVHLILKAVYLISRITLLIYLCMFLNYMYILIVIMTVCVV